MVFYWSLRASKFPQVSEILPRILINLNNAVVWIDSIRPRISNFSTSLSKPLGTGPSAPVTIGITVFFLVFWKGPSTCFCSRFLWFSLYHRLAVLVGRLSANGPGDLGSIPGRVITKTLKMVLDTSLLNTQRYKVGIKCEVKQSRKKE